MTARFENTAHKTGSGKTKAIDDILQIIIYMLIACESASVVLFLYIRKWNLRLGRNLHANRTGRHSQKFLSTKFQIGETLRVTEVFLPILIIKWTLTVFGAAAIYCLRVVSRAQTIMGNGPSCQSPLRCAGLQIEVRHSKKQRAICTEKCHWTPFALFDSPNVCLL